MSNVDNKVRAIHNLVGHPLMQIFIWLKCPRFATWVHDKTL